MAHVICKSELVERCRAFAKALHYKEMEFEGALSKKMDANPVAVVEALIHTNTQGYIWFAFRYTHNPKRGVVLVSVNSHTTKWCLAQVESPQVHRRGGIWLLVRGYCISQRAV
ncbi:hypothetical protein CTI12_AA069190 [Artemisia annua]|uniref:Uncharacterized protein n=1 Tax=Artemisia annua TaxID=35608 RepID=A0A2U1Q6R9_ARTAN|nr:hypothetical protein CTI12_AA069190 [Artemisia annua]